MHGESPEPAPRRVDVRRSVSRTIETRASEKGGDALERTARRGRTLAAFRTTASTVARAAGAALLAVALVVSVLLVSAPLAHAVNSDVAPPDIVPSDTDGSCETPPAGYPADGEPVPARAGCTLVIGADDSVVGEVWSWRDATSVHWYSYPAATTQIAAGSVLMCGSTDVATAGLVYECSADSTYLLFTVSSVFVEWPASPTGPLHYCQSVRFERAEGDLTGTACSSVALAVTDAPAPTTSPLDNLATAAPAPSSTQSAPVPGPTVSVEPSPPAPATAAPGTAPAPTTPVPPPPPFAETTFPTAPTALTQTEPTSTSSSSTMPTTTSTSAALSSSSQGDAGPAPAAPTVGSEPGPVTGSTPLEAASVAVVGGARFPLGFVIALAVALAVGGIIMLSGPGFAAARRRRR